LENGAGLFPSVWRLGALYVLVYRHNSARLVSTGVEADDGALAPECYLLAQNTSVHASPLRDRGSKKFGRCGRIFLFKNGQHGML